MSIGLLEFNEISSGPISVWAGILLIIFIVVAVVLWVMLARAGKL